jgi:type II secretory pathway component PulL
MKKEYRVVSLVLSIVVIIFLVFQIGFGIFAAYQMNAMDDTLRSQQELANQQFDKFRDKNQSVEKRSEPVKEWSDFVVKQQSQSVEKESDVECLSYDQFIAKDAESKKLFEKSANGLTMCRKKKEEQSPNDAQKSEGQP